MDSTYLNLLQKKGLKVSNTEDVMKIFLDTLLETNKTYDFFCGLEEGQKFCRKKQSGDKYTQLVAAHKRF